MPPAAKKRVRAVKDEAVRRLEADTIRAKLDDLGMADEALGRAIQPALEDFAVRGWGSTAAHTFPEYNIAVLLQLSLQPHIPSFARVRRLGAAATAAAPAAASTP